MLSPHFQVARTPIRALRAMAATSHTLATQTALQILHDGGNAMDAAIAACAVLCVVEPHNTGLGGDCFVLYAPGGRQAELIAYNGSGRSPNNATIDWYAGRDITAIEQYSPHAVTIPGAVRAWQRLADDHGNKDLGELLQPAIEYARSGYPITAWVAHDWANAVATLSHDPTTRSVFLREGRPPPAGKVHRQPRLAKSLATIAAHGADEFYTGSIAADLVARLQSLGGLHTREDFAGAQGEYVEPIATDYRGNTVYECPPNGQGIIALEILNILSGFDIAALQPLSAQRLHLAIEAARLAYADRDAVLADPRTSPAPIEAMLSRRHAARLRARIDPEHAARAQPVSLLATHHDTVYLCVVDEDRNAVSFINSLFRSFGSGIMGPESGILLHNRGCGFVVEPGHPNCIGPNKRPLHTIIPGMVCRNGRVKMPFGVMGGPYQAFGHACMLSNLFDHDMDVQQAIDLPRVMSAPNSGSVDIEPGIETAVIESLRERGHSVTDATRPIGGAQIIAIDWETGLLAGGSDSRKDGCALGY